MRIFNTSSRLGQYHSLTQVLTQYQYQFQYQKCSIPIPKISSIEFPGFDPHQHKSKRRCSNYTLLLPKRVDKICDDWWFPFRHKLCDKMCTSEIDIEGTSFTLYLLPLLSLLKEYFPDYHVYADDKPIFWTWELSDSLVAEILVLEKVAENFSYRNLKLNLNCCRTQCMLVNNLRVCLSESFVMGILSKWNVVLKLIGAVLDRKLSFCKFLNMVRGSCCFHLRSFPSFRKVSFGTTRFQSWASWPAGLTFPTHCFMAYLNIWLKS